MTDSPVSPTSTPTLAIKCPKCMTAGAEDGAGPLAEGILEYAKARGFDEGETWWPEFAEGLAEHIAVAIRHQDFAYRAATVGNAMSKLLSDARVASGREGGSPPSEAEIDAFYAELSAPDGKPEFDRGQRTWNQRIGDALCAFLAGRVSGSVPAPGSE